MFPRLHAVGLALSGWLTQTDTLAAICEHESMNGDFCRLMQRLALCYEVTTCCNFVVFQAVACHVALLPRNLASAAQDLLLHSPCKTYTDLIPQTIDTLQECIHLLQCLKVQCRVLGLSEHRSAF